MKAFLYGLTLQWKMDIRSRTLLITCYVVPLLFFLLMGGVFTSVMPEAKDTLIASMTVMGITMGAFIGLPPSLAEVYRSDIKKVYKANGIPLWTGLATMLLSSFIHLIFMSVILYILAPLLFDASLPANPMSYFAAVGIFAAVSLGVGGVLGLAVKNQAKLTMVSQVVFLPSIMLSGIMFSANLLPKALRAGGKILPAVWGYRLMQENGFCFGNLWPIAAILIFSALTCAVLMKKLKSE